MKIERINDAQMKFVLTKSDLDKRNLEVTDLAYGSSKTQELFQDIIETATKEFSFNVEDTPLMIEAVPISKVSIMIILTKVSNPVSYQETEGGFRKSAKDRKASNDMSLEEFIKENKKENVIKKDKTKKKKKILKSSKNKCIVYSYENLNQISEISKKITEELKSSIYKYDNRYILIVDIKDEEVSIMNKIEHIMMESGTKIDISQGLMKAYIQENGETIIQIKALSVMSKM